MKLSSVFSIAISILSICCVTSILLLVYRRKLKPKSEQIGKISLSRAIPFGVLILLSIILIGAAIGTKYEMIEGENMDELVKGFFPILRNSRQQLNQTKTSIMSSENKLLNANDQFSESIVNITGYEDIEWHDKDGIRVAVKKASSYMKKLDPWFKGLNYTGCTSTVLISDSVAMEVQIKTFRDEVIEYLNSGEIRISRKLSDTVSIVRRLTYRQRNVDFGKSRIDNGIETRKRIVNSFESDMINVQSTRQRLIENMIESMPDRQLVFKTLVLTFCALLIILSVITIVVIARKPMLFKKPTLIYIFGFVTILIDLIIIIISFDVIGKCSLNNENFGLRNFVSVVPGNETVSICKTTFFGDLGNDTLITYQNLAESFKYEEYKKKRRLTYADKTSSFKLPGTKYHDTFVGLGHDVKRLQDLWHLTCFNQSDQDKLAEYASIMQNVLDQNKHFEGAMVRYNTFAANYTHIVDQEYDRYFSKALKDLENEIYLIHKQIMAADFSCAPLLDKFINVGQSICDQINVPIDLFLIYLTIIVMMFICFLVFNIVLYRRSDVSKQNETSDVKPSEVI